MTSAVAETRESREPHSRSLNSPDESISGRQRAERTPPQSTPEQREQARLARQQAKAAWPPVRQPHPGDWDYLRGILHRHGIEQIPPEAEPATVKRLAKLIRRTGLTVTQAEQAVNLKLAKLIDYNPGVALWWLLATTLEAVPDGEWPVASGQDAQDASPSPS